METMLAVNHQEIEITGGDKVQTKFAKDAPPNVAKYSLGDSAADQDDRMDYHLQIITKEDKLKVLKFLQRFFFRDEPLNQSIKLIPEGEDSTCTELEEYCSSSSMDNNLSLMAVSNSGAIVGVALNGKLDPPSEEEPEYITTCANPKFKQILRLLHYVDKNVNRDGQYRGLNVLEFKIISVDSSWRGNGIAKVLVEKTLEIARQRGFHVARADCSSYFSAKAFARLGFKPVYEINYADYVDDDGNPIFSPSLPHTAIVTYTKEL